jgi:predicted esterase
MKTSRLTRCLFLFGLLPFAAFSQPSRETEYLDFPPIDKSEHIRLRGDRKITGNTANLILEVPRRVKLSDSIPQALVVTGRVEAVQVDGNVLSEEPVLLEVLPSGSLKGLSTRPLSLDLSQANNDPVSLRVRFDSFADAPLLQIPEWTVQKVDSLLDSVLPEYRNEIQSWVEEANHQHLIWGKFPLWPNLDRALAQPENPYKGLTGFLIRSYENELLRKRQPYTVYVPESLDLSAPAPLMILLHGSGGDYRNLVADYAAGQEFESHPMLIANAGAFKNTEFRHMPQHDVMRIIEDMQKKYKIDPDRIYAQGISLGGRGVLDLAAREPDVFAAISSQGSYGVHHELMDPFFAVEKDPVAYRLAAKNDIRTWLPNLSTTPVEMVFGWQDTSTRPVGALAIAIRLQRLGISVVERGFDQGHNLTLPDYDWDSSRAWFLTHSKNRVPRRLQFRVDNLRHNLNAWIRVDALHDYSDIGDVQALLTAEGKIDLSTRNVAQLTYLPPDPSLPGANVFPKETRVIFFDKNDQPREPVSTKGPVKHPGQSGPLWNFFSDPVLIVTDTTTEDKNLLNRITSGANLNAYTDSTPKGWRFPVKDVQEVTEEDLKTCNVLFVTYQNSPHPWRDAIPVPLPDGVEASEKETLIALRPSPWSDNRTVILLELGNTFSAPPIYGMGIFQEPLQVDWMILENRQFKAAGVYNHDWTPGPMTTESFFTRVITR